MDLLYARMIIQYEIHFPRFIISIYYLVRTIVEYSIKKGLINIAFYFKFFNFIPIVRIILIHTF